MFPGKHGVGHYSRKPTRDNTYDSMRESGGKKLKWWSQSEDEEITRILDGRYAKNTIRQIFSEAVGDVEGLTDR